MREHPFHTLTLNTVALLLVGVDHMLPIVKNILQMIKRTRISSTIIVIRDIIDCSNYSKCRCEIGSWSSTEKHVGKIHFYVFCLSYLVQPVGNVRYSPGLELNQRWKPICLIHLLHFTSIFPMVLQIYMCRFKLWTVILQAKPFVQWTVCKPVVVFDIIFPSVQCAATHEWFRHKSSDGIGCTSTVTSVWGFPGRRNERASPGIPSLTVGSACFDSRITILAKAMKSDDRFVCTIGELTVSSQMFKCGTWFFDSVYFHLWH